MIRLKTMICRMNTIPGDPDDGMTWFVRPGEHIQGSGDLVNGIEGTSFTYHPVYWDPEEEIEVASNRKQREP